MEITEKDIKDLMKQIDIIKDSIDSIDVEVSLIEQGIDSLDMLNVYLLIEEKYNIKIPDEDIPKLTSIKNIVDYIKSKKDKR